MWVNKVPGEGLVTGTVTSVEGAQLRTAMDVGRACRGKGQQHKGTGRNSLCDSHQGRPTARVTRDHLEGFKQRGFFSEPHRHDSFTVPHTTFLNYRAVN